MGNFLSNSLEDVYTDTDTYNENAKLKQVIEEQFHMIQLLKHKKYSDMCFKNGIVQDAGSNSKQDMIKAKEDRNYEYLVFSGGGVKGISYCGALQVLESMDILSNVKGFAGTSAGSIVAGLLAVGFTPKELTNILNELDVRQLMDDKFGYIRDAVNFVEDYGVCPGKFIYDFLGEKIKQKTGDPDYTIKQVYKDLGVTLVIVTTDLNCLRTVYLHPKNPNKAYRNLSVRQAIRMSTSIPFIFEPVHLNGDYFADGGVLDNYAIHVFDGAFPGDPKARLNLCPPNSKVLGFKIVTDDETLNYSVKPRQEIKSLLQYSLSYIDIFMTENERRTMTPSNWLRTVHIITPDYPMTDFNLDSDKKSLLIEAGIRYTNDFFQD